MPRSLFVAGLAAVLAVGVIGCSSDEPGLSNQFGECVFAPGTQCPDADLAAVSAPQSDLRNANFAGANLKGVDFGHADLRDVNFSGANLSRAVLVGADLRGADLSDAILFQATMTGARWVGSVRTGTRYCETLLPSGSVSECPELDVVVPGSQVPAEIVTFEATSPVRCHNDFIGEGVDVTYRVRHASSISFLVDGIPVTRSSKRRGVKRVPFPCDEERHEVEIQAFGEVPPFAAASFELALPPGRPDRPI